MALKLIAIEVRPGVLQWYRREDNKQYKFAFRTNGQMKYEIKNHPLA